MEAGTVALTLLLTRWSDSTCDLNWYPCTDSNERSVIVPCVISCVSCAVCLPVLQFASFGIHSSGCEFVGNNSGAGEYVYLNSVSVGFDVKKCPKVADISRTLFKCPKDDVIVDVPLVNAAMHSQQRTTAQQHVHDINNTAQ